jgi:hypothetical protein
MFSGLLRRLQCEKNLNLGEPAALQLLRLFSVTFLAQKNGKLSKAFIL